MEKLICPKCEKKVDNFAFEIVVKRTGDIGLDDESMPEYDEGFDIYEQQDRVIKLTCNECNEVVYDNFEYDVETFLIENSKKQKEEQAKL